MNNEQYVTQKEFCEFLKISRNTLNKWFSKGMPKLQPGGRGKILIPKFKALKWIELSTPRSNRRNGAIV